MGSGAVKTIVLLMVLVVLSFLIGAQVSDGLTDSMGAFAVIGAVAIGFLLLLLGKNSWYLVFLLPPILNNLPIQFIDGNLAIYLVSVGMFAYYYVQSKAMGYMQMKWHSVPFLDVTMLFIFIYMCVSYYKYPVAIDVLAMDMEYVGGRPYVYAVGAFVYFLFLSLLNVRRADMEKVVKWAFYVQVAAMLLTVALGLKSGNIYWAGQGGEEADFSGDVGEKRITVFSSIGFFMLTFAYASRPILSLLRSPLYLGLCGASFLGIALTGARNQLVQSVLYAMGVSLLRREMALIVMMGMVLWVVLLALGGGGAFETLPPTAQRFIAIVPGVHVSDSVRRDTEGSSKVRLIAWKQAFEPKNGYIRDYIWGDGFQRSVKELQRIRTAQMRGNRMRISIKDNTLARTGNWHNGFISTMHRLGLIGCALFYTVFFIGIAMFVKVGRFYVGKSFFPYFCAFAINTFVFPFVYSYNARNAQHFFASITALSFVKLLYCLLREQGEIGPMFRLHQRYVPLMIQEEQTRAQVS